MNLVFWSWTGLSLCEKLGSYLRFKCQLPVWKSQVISQEAVYLSKIFAGTQPLRKDTSKRNLCHGADLSTYVAQVIQLHPLQIGPGAGTLSMDSQFVGWPPRSKRRPDQMIVILQEVWVRKRKISEEALGDNVKFFFFGGGAAERE